MDSCICWQKHFNCASMTIIRHNMEGYWLVPIVRVDIGFCLYEHFNKRSIAIP